MLSNIDSVLAGLPTSMHTHPLDAPRYNGVLGGGIALAVESMKDHTTDEGWQIMAGLAHAGYSLCGHKLVINETDVSKILARRDASDVGVVVVQDKREWDVQPGDFRDPSARFTNVEYLSTRPDLFKLTILKDAHQRPGYHRKSADEIGCHAWIVYYHPRLVKHMASYVRSEHLIRTYHSLDAAIVPPYTPDRAGCLLSGALSSVYPLRMRMVRESSALPEVQYLRHPGYHRNGCCTPGFLHLLSRFKVALCTCSIYGYSLRKIIEATACGCVVVTNLPVDEAMPGIDTNLVRIPNNASSEDVAALLRQLYASYEPERQAYYAKIACQLYDYRAVGAKLVHDIEALRRQYNR